MGPERGTYALLLEASGPASVQVGRLGHLARVAGFYVYVGSAFGPGGLGARLGRHLSGSGRCRWHIDYLRRVTRPLGAWLTTDPVAREHRWAAAVGVMAGASMPLTGFGASDCACPSHLFFFSHRPTVEGFRHALARMDDVPARPIEEVSP